MPTKPLALAVAALLLTLATPAAARSGEVALTYDDLPGVTLPDQPWVEAANRDLLAGLRRHRIKVTGFVNEGKLVQLDPQDKTTLLRNWLRAGMDLGNHTYSHESLNVLGAEGFIADIARGEPVTRALLAKRGRTLRWFRYPNLETGPDAATKAKVANWLTSHGYRSAPVTIDADDWEFAIPYDDALRRGEPARAKAICEEYLAHTEAVVDWSRKAAHALFGRDIAYVMLLHDSRLGADTIDALASLLKARKLHAVSLDKAMRDPAYATPDTYVGGDGIEWLERWSKTLGKDLPWDVYPDVPADIAASYDRLESDRLESHRHDPPAGGS